MTRDLLRPSGIDVIDDHWGGLRAGACYLFFGPTRSQRDLFTMATSRAGATSGEQVVFLSRRHPRTLEVRARDVGMDLRRSVADQRVKLLRIPDRLVRDAGDDVIEDALQKVARLVRRQNPDRLVIEDFAPFVRMRSLARLRESCLRFLDHITDSETTTILGLGEPANLYSQEVVAFLRGQLAGMLHIEPGEGQFARRLTMMPALGSLGEELSLDYDIRRLAESTAEVDPDQASRASAAETTSPPATCLADDLTSEFGEGAARIRFLSKQEMSHVWGEEIDPFSHAGMRSLGPDQSHYLVGLPSGETVGSIPRPTAAQARATPSSRPDRQPTRSIGGSEPQAFTNFQDQLDSFAQVLDAAFDEFVDRGTHFSVASVRAITPVDRASEFHRIAVALRALAHDQRHLLVDSERGHAALLINGRTIGSTASLLGALRERLGVGREGDRLLEGVGVMMMPAGHPYLSAADLLEHEFGGSAAVGIEPAT